MRSILTFVFLYIVLAAAVPASSTEIWVKNASPSVNSSLSAREKQSNKWYIAHFVNKSGMFAIHAQCPCDVYADDGGGHNRAETVVSTDVCLIYTGQPTFIVGKKQPGVLNCLAPAARSARQGFGEDPPGTRRPGRRPPRRRRQRPDLDSRAQGAISDGAPPPADGDPLLSPRAGNLRVSDSRCHPIR